MNAKQIEKYVMRYLETLDCQVIEKTPSSVTVKLSPEADKDLTGRSYYWSFVERTGAAPETVTFRFIFDPAREAIGAGQAVPPAGGATVTAGATPSQSSPAGFAGAAPGGLISAQGSPSSAAGTGMPANAAITADAAPLADSGSILGRYFGVNLPSPVGRVPTDTLTFGSRRLEQIFSSVRGRGRFVRLFEENKAQKNAPRSAAYSTWLGVNYKVELSCDVKRDEIHTLGIHLGTGEIAEQFDARMRKVKLTQRIPANIYLQPNKLTLPRAAQLLENDLEKRISAYDHQWADEAYFRLQDELSRIDAYYGELLLALDPDKKPEAEDQYAARRNEAVWQHSPQIRVSVINCGLFHLNGE